MHISKTKALHAKQKFGFNRNVHALRDRDIALPGVRKKHFAASLIGAKDVRGKDVRGKDVRGKDLRGKDVRGKDLRGDDLNDVYREDQGAHEEGQN
ncbi:Protein split ends [Hondaea fermentalgiana]|uniref:Protein split ends n=1 Tax=Hondaea fermentalgiana TaxID=2315210 RepID=A0A2R5GEZ6_9STRA|nr:Protein split ends [Hondaea fermentalgiana]|eukprot:GBG26404.1 Protein split ends [Hondaea fermentalgiana]